jgi:hypothetical protein
MSTKKSTTDSNKLPENKDSNARWRSGVDVTFPTPISGSHDFRQVKKSGFGFDLNAAC